MQISLTGHHVDVTESMREYVNEKIGRLERHFDHALDIHVVFTVEKQRHKAEATMHVAGGNLFADNVEDDMYSAIDGMIDKLDRQGKKHKEKQKNHRGKGVMPIME